MLTTLRLDPRQQVAHGRRVGLALARLARRQSSRAVDRVDVPAGPAGGLRVGVEHAHARPGQVVPVLDLLGIARPDADHDQAAGDHPLVGPGVPVGLDQPGLDQRLHVALEREHRDVGVEPRGDRPGLGAGGVVRLLEPDVAAGLALPLGRERGQQAVVERLADHRIGPDRERVGLGCRLATGIPR